MNVQELVKHRLEELGHEQRDLAAAAEVTDSYISQLLTGKKSLPAPNRSDIYDKIETFLNLPTGELAKLVDVQRRDELRTKIEEPAAPLYRDTRELILEKCHPEKVKPVRSIFEKEPFGAIERIITQKLLDLAKGVAKEQWNDEKWLRGVAEFNRKSYEEMRVIVLEFLDTDIFNLSVPNFLYFLEPLVKTWDINLVTFSMRIILVTGPGRERVKAFELMETNPETEAPEEPGLKEFLRETSLSGHLTQEELAFLKRLRFDDKRPNALYYYRELQNLRDPLHFQTTGSKRERSFPRDGAV